ncbi:MAG: ATP synthase F0 subunit C, partial [Planctomycetaceae bacterium]
MTIGLALLASPAFAAGEGFFAYSGAMAAAVTILGAAYGFGKIGAAALESIARQPEAAGDIRGSMIFAAALLEGATFFALIVCILRG